VVNHYFPCRICMSVANAPVMFNSIVTPAWKHIFRTFVRTQFTAIGIKYHIAIINIDKVQNNDYNNYGYPQQTIMWVAQMKGEFSCLRYELVKMSQLKVLSNDSRRNAKTLAF
jgi:hypothetical protein